MNTKMIYDYSIPTRTLFGSGRLNELYEQQLPGKKAAIIISNGKSTRTNGYLDRTIEQLQKRGVEYVIFDQIEPNPLSTTVDRGGTFVRANNCDFLVALGGGSVMDAAKGIAAMATNNGTIWDYVLFGTGKKQPLANDPLPIVAITTTAGTGSETDAGSVITNPATNEKTAFFNPKSFPVLAIVDPELTLSVPPKFTAFQGFDALFHCTEGYIAKTANLISDMYALTAIENIAANLPTAVHNGKILAAREHVSFANTLAGTVMMTSNCTSEHSLEHALSAFHQTLPHGAGLIMISKAYYTHFINKHVCDDRFIRMAQAMGNQNANVPMDFIEALVKLQQACGVADLKMSDYGITPDEFEKFAHNAQSAMDFLFPCDRTVLSIADCVAIYTDSYK